VNDALTTTRARHGTLLHGDVKGANILFSKPPFRSPSSDGTPLLCALYDLQYVGRGPPTHDLVYFLGTSVDPRLLAPGPEGERSLLDFYYTEISLRLPAGVVYPREVFDAQWALSVVDWTRFMAGWGYWGNSDWARRRAEGIVQQWEKGEWEKLLNTIGA
jgi:hypothetical protein